MSWRFVAKYCTCSVIGFYFSRIILFTIPTDLRYTNAHICMYLPHLSSYLTPTPQCMHSHTSICTPQLPKKSDKGFLDKLLKEHGGRETSGLKKWSPKDRKGTFTINHYAGPVQYNVEGFLVSTADSLPHDLHGLMLTSKNLTMNEIFSSEQAGSHMPSAPSRRASGNPMMLQRSRSRKSVQNLKATLASKFRRQLGTLVKMLRRTSSHFIHCLKPNNTRSKNKFLDRMIRTQIQQLGLQAVCDVRRMGYNCRFEFHDFVCHFARCLSLDDHRCKISAITKPIDDDDEGAILEKWKDRAFELVTTLDLAASWPEDDLCKVLCFGRTRLFMKEVANQRLQELRYKALDNVVILPQALVRRFLARVKYCNYQKLLTSLRQAIKDRDADAMRNGLKESLSLPHEGTHIPLVSEARSTLDLVERQEQHQTLLQGFMEASASSSSMDLMSDVDTEELRQALDEARKLQMQEFEVLKQCESLMKRLLDIDEYLKVLEHKKH